MKPLRYLTLVMLCCLFANLRAQYVTIPDGNFVTWLQNKYPACMSGNQLDSTCAAVISDTLVQCQLKNIHDLTGIQYFDNLRTLDASKNALSSLPVFPATLKKITVSYNRLTSLNGLPAGLQILIADSNLLSALPVWPVGLKQLSLSLNALSSVTLPAGLILFTCSNAQLTALPALPATLTRLKVDYNTITQLPALPAGFKNLTCSYNRLTSLPALPQSLQYLICENNQLDSLPVLNDSLQILSCGSNPLQSLPSLPASLIYLHCGNNQLDSLPALPPLVYELYCDNNRLTYLPQLPLSLKYFVCNNNLLYNLPDLPDSLLRLACINNPNLHCLPRLKPLEFLSFDSVNIACVPNYVNIQYSSSPRLSNVPLCQPGNAAGCIVNWNIGGTVYNDTSNDCRQQPGETNVAFVKVKLTRNNNVLQQTYTGISGVYSFLADTGDYIITLDRTGLPFSVVCPPQNLDTLTLPAGALLDNRDFALFCRHGYDIAAWSILSGALFRPAALVPVNILAGDHALQWAQHCNTANLSGQLITTITGPATYVGPAPGALTPAVAGNVLTYTINNWSGVNPLRDFNILMQVDTTAQAGQQVCVAVDVEPIAADYDTANNHLTHCFNVLASYDPNVKEVYPSGIVDITSDHWLTYTVHFQNTGTSYAENIHVTDTLDANVDAETFQLLAYSFAPAVTLKGRAVRFDFNQIHLPDSTTNEPGSHGYVQYKVRAKSNLQSGATVTNTAFIYFDFNAPVVTNTTSTTYTMFEGIATVSGNKGTMQLYPNPATDMVMVNLSDNLTGGILTLSDVTGRSLNTVPVASTHAQLSTANLSSGVYLVTVVKGEIRVVKRLIIGH